MSVYSCAYYWGITGLLIGATLYRPAYGAVALKNSILDTPQWLYFWSAFIIVSVGRWRQRFRCPQC